MGEGDERDPLLCSEFGEGVVNFQPSFGAICAREQPQPTWMEDKSNDVPWVSDDFSNGLKCKGVSHVDYLT